MAPLLSVIMPNYNMAHFLPEVLDSLFTQTYQDYELVFVDDGSTDQSVAVLKSFNTEQHRVRILLNPKNLGAVSTVNRGIKEAYGKYIFLLAADDKIVEKTFFEKMVPLLNANPTYSMCTSDHGSFEDGTQKIHAWRVFPHLQCPIFLSPKEFLLNCREGKINYWLFAMGTIFRKDLFEKYGCFYNNLPVLSDWYFIHLCALKEGCIYLPGTYIAWRYRGAANLNSHMKKNEPLKLISLIAKRWSHRHLFNRSLLLGCYVQHSLRQLIFRPYLWDFVYPFFKRKMKNLIKKSLNRVRGINEIPVSRNLP